MIEPGQVLDNRYELLELLGSGGMGNVYKVKDRSLDLVVALKMLHKVTPQQFLRFQNEAKAAGRMNHQNLVKVLTFGIVDDSPYLVMEYIEGRDLSTIIRQDGPIPWQKSIAIFIQICDALSHAHKKGILHRDLKPSNVLLINQGVHNGELTVKVLDFGISKFFGAETPTQYNTSPGQLVGTPSYMSPEQVSGAKVDARSDIYAMGCLMFETLIGRAPFTGESVLEVLQKKVDQKAPLLSELVPMQSGFPKDLEDIVAKALATSPASRFQTIERLKIALLSIGKEPPASSLQAFRLPLFRMELLSIMVIVGFAVVWIVISNGISPRQPADQKARIILTTSPPLLPLDYPSEVRKEHVTPLSDGTCAVGDYDMVKITKDLLRKIAKINNLTRLELSDSFLTDKEVEEIARIQTLTNLDLSKTDITDTGVQHLTELKNLESLDLSQTGITNNALSVLARLPNLRSLILDGSTRITPTGLNAMVDSKIATLSLKRIKLNDSIVKILKRFKHLRLVRLQDTNLSESAISNLATDPVLTLEVSEFSAAKKPPNVRVD